MNASTSGAQEYADVVRCPFDTCISIESSRNMKTEKRRENGISEYNENKQDEKCVTTEQHINK